MASVLRPAPVGQGGGAGGEMGRANTVQSASRLCHSVSRPGEGRGADETGGGADHRGAGLGANAGSGAGNALRRGL